MFFDTAPWSALAAVGREVSAAAVAPCRVTFARPLETHPEPVRWCGSKVGVTVDGEKGYGHNARTNHKLLYRVPLAGKSA